MMLLTMTSCVKNSFEDKWKDIIVNCDTSQDFLVPISPNCITVVTLDGDTLAVTDRAMTIKVPKGYTTTRSVNNLSITYVDESDINFKILQQQTYCAAWTAIMFEDSKQGDYDYNDLIIHVYSKVNTPWGKNIALQNISIQPIALGNTKNISLGCILSDNSEHILYRNVREELFDSNVGFINTVNDKSPIRFKLRETPITDWQLELNSTKSYWIAWFIEVDGNRIYAVSSDFEYNRYDNVISKDLLPYGIVVANDNGTFKYPQEMTSVFNAYPSFKDWAYNYGMNIGKPNKDHIYKYCYDKTIDGKYKIWDYEDLKN